MCIAVCKNLSLHKCDELTIVMTTTTKEKEKEEENTLGTILSPILNNSASTQVQSLVVLQW